jgi:hypothetical protein
MNSPALIFKQGGVAHLKKDEYSVKPLLNSPIMPLKYGLSKNIP